MKLAKIRLLQIICTVTVTCFVASAALAHRPSISENSKSSLAPMLKRVMPAIVNIAVEKMTMKNLNELIPAAPNDDRQVPIKSFAVGSGVIFNAQKGYIVTNAHVIKNQKVIVVTLKNGIRYHAKLIAKAKDYDIAILQIHAPHLIALPFGNADGLQVGDFVTAIGSPFGLSETVTSGVISALHRSHPQLEGFQNFIQTDAPINPGNSGGALINMKGQLIGINTAIVAPTDSNAGIGFAIPSNMVNAVIKQLLKYGQVKRGALGVLIQNLTPALANTLGMLHQKGAIVSDVIPDSPASDADIKVGDVITKVDGQPVRDSVDLKNTLGLIRPDTAVSLTLIRDHQTRILPVTMGDPNTLKASVVPYLNGLRLQDFKELESDGTELRGVIVASVSDTSMGALAGLQPGDVITEINHHPVHGLLSLKKQIKKLTKPALLRVARGRSQLFLVLRAN